ncbi:hypothetical protein EDB80DRAFT_688872 [Ilyonectria destructans]|nr:hypothetical protein EDB80DRAFT_688872 [Ilyonectria destructans]
MSVRERGKGGHQRPASIGDQGAETFRVRKVTRENRCSPSPDSVFVKDGLGVVVASREMAERHVTALGGARDQPPQGTLSHLQCISASVQEGGGSSGGGALEAWGVSGAPGRVDRRIRRSAHVSGVLGTRRKGLPGLCRGRQEPKLLPERAAGGRATCTCTGIPVPIKDGPGARKMAVPSSLNGMSRSEVAPSPVTPSPQHHQAGRLTTGGINRQGSQMKGQEK